MLDWPTALLPTRATLCPACQGDVFGPLATVNGYTVARCRSCRLVMVNPQPTRDSLADFYHRVYYSHPEAVHSISREQVLEQTDGKKLAFSQESSRLARLCAGRRLLDVGCAFGSFMMAAESHGFTTTGVEYNPAVAAQARSFGLDVVTGDFLEIDLPDNTFDVITFWYVLEHVADPVSVLKRAHDLLRPGGLLFVRVPNLAFGLPFLWLTRFGFSRLSSIFSHIPAHLFFYNYQSLRQLCLSVGFDKVRFEPGRPVLVPSPRSKTAWGNRARMLYSSGANLIAQLTRGHVLLAPYFSVLAARRM